MPRELAHSHTHTHTHTLAHPAHARAPRRATNADIMARKRASGPDVYVVQVPASGLKKRVFETYNTLEEAQAAVAKHLGVDAAFTCGGGDGLPSGGSSSSSGRGDEAAADVRAAFAMLMEKYGALASGARGPAADGGWRVLATPSDTSWAPSAYLAPCYRVAQFQRSATRWRRRRRRRPSTRGSAPASRAPAATACPAAAAAAGAATRRHRRSRRPS
jgi:hypothetical protein